MNRRSLQTWGQTLSAVVVSISENWLSEILENIQPMKNGYIHRWSPQCPRLDISTRLFKLSKGFDYYEMIRTRISHVQGQGFPRLSFSRTLPVWTRSTLKFRTTKTGSLKNQKTNQVLEFELRNEAHRQKNDMIAATDLWSSIGHSIASLHKLWHLRRSVALSDAWSGESRYRAGEALL